MSEKFPSSPSIELQKTVDASRNAEQFYATIVDALGGLTDLQKENVHRHIQKHPGAWDLVDGSHVTVIDYRVEDSRLIFTIEVSKTEGGSEEVHGEIPLE